MKVLKSRWLAAAFALLIITGLSFAQPSDQEKSKDKSKDKSKSSGKGTPAPNKRPDSGSQYPPGKGPPTTRPGDPYSHPNNSTSPSSDRTAKPGEEKTHTSD